ncbi:MAG TPA: homoserine O-succinyltransferase [Alphaproteobacteria bacterium]
MPIKIPHALPGRSILEQEHISFILEDRALRQDIRPLQVAILNLMPDKITTETQLLRALGHTPLQIEVTLLHASSHTSKNTSADHLEAFYKSWDEVKDRKFDALIVTGAPVAHLPYEDVTYWTELTNILDWAKTHVYSSFFLCWAAFASLYYYDGIQKNRMPQKLSGIYPHKVVKPFVPLVAGFDDFLDVPVSRYSEIREEDILAHQSLDILVKSDLSGVFIVEDKDNNRVYILNHLEYDVDTLQKEYQRDVAAGTNPNVPYNYFPDNDPSREPAITWRAHRTLLFSNWINMVYQGTPYDLNEIGKIDLLKTGKVA